ncbi:hypothetical protein ACFJGV_18795 [Cnuibacter sp. UC19_7]|uniref:hypothetical protein n=1 Tax=Cnuibacter sp. UC19_7 TaxID=3350166 RepID=UPI003671AF2A
MIDAHVLVTDETAFHTEFGELRRVRAAVDLPFHGVRSGQPGGWVSVGGGVSLSGRSWLRDEAVLAEEATLADETATSGSTVASSSWVRRRCRPPPTSSSSDRSADVCTASPSSVAGMDR